MLGGPGHDVGGGGIEKLICPFIHQSLVGCGYISRKRRSIACAFGAYRCIPVVLASVKYVRHAHYLKRISCLIHPGESFSGLSGQFRKNKYLAKLKHLVYFYRQSSL